MAREATKDREGSIDWVFSDEELKRFEALVRADERNQALAAPTVQEPVWIQPDHLQKAQKAPFLCRVEPHKRDDFVPLYPTPPAAQRQWVGLTARDWNVIGFTAEFRAGAEWANDKLKEKNT
jgi:hypothetical protein